MKVLFISHSCHDRNPMKVKTQNNVSRVSLFASHPLSLSLARMAIACGSDILAIVTDEGSMYTMGYGRYDLTCAGGTLQLFQQSLFLDRDETFDGEGVVMVAFGGHHGACVTQDCSVWTWGSGILGQMGIRLVRSTRATETLWSFSCNYGIVWSVQHHHFDGDRTSVDGRLF